MEDVCMMIQGLLQPFSMAEPNPFRAGTLRRQASNGLRRFHRVLLAGLAVAFQAFGEVSKAESQGGALDELKQR